MSDRPFISYRLCHLQEWHVILSAEWEKAGNAERTFRSWTCRRFQAKSPACDALATDAHAHAFDLRRSYANAEVRDCRQDADRPDLERGHANVNETE